VQQRGSKKTLSGTFLLVKPIGHYRTPAVFCNFEQIHQNTRNEPVCASRASSRSQQWRSRCPQHGHRYRTAASVSGALRAVHCAVRCRACSPRPGMVYAAHVGPCLCTIHAHDPSRTIHAACTIHADCSSVCCFATARLFSAQRCGLTADSCCYCESFGGAPVVHSPSSSSSSSTAA
jgi:hypothetical protein